jgi:RNA polymerase sigma-70 factor (ECF subfamily)
VSADQAATLVTAAKAGSDLAFTRLLEIVLEPSYKLACGMLHDPPTAEDAVQEAALKAWRKLGQLREGQALKPWFLSIVANECREVRRSRWWSLSASTTRSGDEAEPARVHKTPDDSILTGMEVRRALRALNHEKRLVVVLRWYLDMSIEDISAVTGSSVHAVEARLYRGMNELRRRLEGRDVDR